MHNCILPRRWLLLMVSVALIPCVLCSDLSSLFYTTNSPDHVEFADDGQEIQLALDMKNASGFQSYDSYLFGHFNMRLKLVPGDSAGTVTTYYFSSLGPNHDELDFEFLGNVSGQPLILQTNVYASGVGGREQRIFLWFDPTADFHNYTILWNPQQVVFLVDEIPIRVYPNIEAQTGVPYLHNQSMYVYGTIWDGDSWATQGGAIKINWTHSPFVASYRDFTADACSRAAATTSVSEAALAQSCAAAKWWSQLAYQKLSDAQLGQLKWVQSNLTVYDYCTDYARYNVTPAECFYNTPIELSPTTTITGTTSGGAASPASSPSESQSSASPSAIINRRSFLITFLFSLIASVLY